MARLSLQQFAEFSGGELIGPTTGFVERLAFDSRKLLIPQDAIFIAIKGVSHDGHAYIEELYRRGIRAFMVETLCDYSAYPDSTFIQVSNSVIALQNVASEIRKEFKFPIIAITGSNGKTVVKEWASRLLERQMTVGRSPRSYNSQLGVPLSLWMLEEECDVALIEAGISMPNEMSNLEKCIQPQIGVITNIGQAHQENFTSLESKLEQKLELFQNAEVILYNFDHHLINITLASTYPNKQTKSYGSSESADLQLISQSNSQSSTILKLKYADEIVSLSIPFVDSASIENALASVLLALHFNMPWKEIQAGLEDLQPAAMRLEQKEGVNNCLLIDDAYNSDLTSLELALDFLNQLGSRKGLSKTLILSDIYQSGMDADRLYKQVKEIAKVKGVDRFIGIGPQLYKTSGGKDAYMSTEDFLNHIHISDFKNEAILLKGSRSFSFERISDILEKQRHKTVLEVNLNALMNNVQFFKSNLKPEVKLLAMVKAFSYGSGSFEIANVLQHQKVDCLGVAFADEGIELREAGINLPIIVMNPEVSSFPLMLQYDLEPEIYSFNVLQSYLRSVEREGLSKVPIHIKVDTGMNRLGFLPEDMNRLIKMINSSPRLKVDSVFSHLAGSDDAVHDDFTKMQAEIFIKCCERIEEGLGYSFIKHILNSAGIERFPEYQFDMVRLGIGMYGISASNNDLQNVGTLKSYVSQLKEVKKGDSIGYNRRGQAQSNINIAIVPVGYADGLNRRLSNGVGRVVINNQQAPIIGNICMDMCMVDVSNLSVKEGDEVEIFGSNYTINDIAEALNTIPYEVLTSISRRVKRVYYLE